MYKADFFYSLFCQCCAELDAEKKKRAVDMEEADNVTCLLEKDRERLRQEVISAAFA